VGGGEECGRGGVRGWGKSASQDSSSKGMELQQLFDYGENPTPRLSSISFPAFNLSCIFSSFAYFPPRCQPESFGWKKKFPLFTLPNLVLLKVCIIYCNKKTS
jgi:hypothetical protein